MPSVSTQTLTYASIANDYSKEVSKNRWTSRMLRYLVPTKPSNVLTLKEILKCIPTHTVCRIHTGVTAVSILLHRCSDQATNIIIIIRIDLDTAPRVSVRIIGAWVCAFSYCRGDWTGGFSGGFWRYQVFKHSANKNEGKYTSMGNIDFIWWISSNLDNAL